MTRLTSEAIRFALVGSANTAIGLLAIYASIYLFGLNALTANALGFAIGLMVSFALNRKWTFKDKQGIRKTLPKFLGSALFCYLLNLGTVYGLDRQLHAGPYLPQLFGIVVYTLSMFLTAKIYVFKAKNQNIRQEIL